MIMAMREKSAELVYSTNELESTGKRSPARDVNVNAVRPVFIKRDRTEVPIANMSDEEIAEAIHFTEEFIERQQASIDKMQKVQKYLIIESAGRLKANSGEEWESYYQLEGERIPAYPDYYAYERSKTLSK